MKEAPALPHQVSVARPSASAADDNPSLDGKGSVVTLVRPKTVQTEPRATIRNFALDAQTQKPTFSTSLTEALSIEELMFHARRDDVAAMKAVIERAGLDLRSGRTVNADGRTPLHVAAAYNSAAAADYLIRHGAPVNALDDFLRTPLRDAADAGFEDLQRCEPAPRRTPPPRSDTPPRRGATPPPRAQHAAGGWRPGA